MCGQGLLCYAPPRIYAAHATLAQGNDVGSRAPRRDFRDRDRPPFQIQEGATYYTECGTCSAVYPIDPEILGSGRKVQCCVCENAWFQRPDRLRIVQENKGLKDYPMEKKESLMEERRAYRERVRARRDSGDAPRRSNGRHGGGQKFSIFIGNLPFDATEEALMAHISDTAKVQRVTIIKDRETGRSRGFGFATVSSESEVRAAVDALDGVNFNGRQLTLREGNRN